MTQLMNVSMIRRMGGVCMQSGRSSAGFHYSSTPEVGGELQLKPGYRVHLLLLGCWRLSWFCGSVCPRQASCRLGAGALTRKNQANTSLWIFRSPHEHVSGNVVLPGCPLVTFGGGGEEAATGFVWSLGVWGVEP